MFLSIAPQIQSLCTLKTDRAIRDALADLPKDLSETYSRILRRSEESEKAYQRKNIERCGVYSNRDRTPSLGNASISRSNLALSYVRYRSHPSIQIFLPILL